eukprot:8054499-Alexandrium_andersonii.AAC.1
MRVFCNVLQAGAINPRITIPVEGGKRDIASAEDATIGADVPCKSSRGSGRPGTWRSWRQ